MLINVYVWYCFMFLDAIFVYICNFWFFFQIYIFSYYNFCKFQSIRRSNYLMMNSYLCFFFRLFDRFHIHIRDSKGARRACDLPCALDLTQWKRTLFCILRCTSTYLPLHTLLYTALFVTGCPEEIPIYRPKKITLQP